MSVPKDTVIIKPDSTLDSLADRVADVRRQLSELPPGVIVERALFVGEAFFRTQGFARRAYLAIAARGFEHVDITFDCACDHAPFKGGCHLVFGESIERAEDVTEDMITELTEVAPDATWSIHIMPPRTSFLSGLLASLQDGVDPMDAMFNGGARKNAEMN